MIGAYLLVY